MFFYSASGFFSALPTARMLPVFINGKDENGHHQQRISKENYFLRLQSRLFCG